MLTELRRRLLAAQDAADGATRSTNPLTDLVLATKPDPSEAEMDRYTRYHRSNQPGR